MPKKDQEPIFIVGAVSKLADAIIVMCLIILGAALPILFLWVAYIEASTWLTVGDWASVTVGAIMERPTTEMVGLQKMVDWLYGISVLIPLVIGSVGMWIVCAYIADYSFGHRK